MFLISGLWHGANWTFIIWGAMHGIASVVDRLINRNWNKLLKPVRIVFTYAFDDVLTNLDYYSDTIHFNGEVCDRIVDSIYNGEGLIEKDSVDFYFDHIKEMFYNLDYSSLE